MNVPPSFDLSQRNALITGGGSGLGFAIAKALVGAGVPMANSEICGLASGPAINPVPGRFTLQNPGNFFGGPGLQLGHRLFRVSRRMIGEDHVVQRKQRVIWAWRLVFEDVNARSTARTGALEQ